jgi:hypothetical protein
LPIACSRPTIEYKISAELAEVSRECAAASLGRAAVPAAVARDERQPTC